MKDIIKNIAKLIDLKSIITIIMVVALVVGFFREMITAEQFVPLITMIITFYFAKQDKKEVPENIEGRG